MAVENGQGMAISGGNSKSFFGRSLPPSLVEISTLSHRGIVNYAPTELVITARAGTTIQQINQCLAEHGQRLAFEPPVLDGKATLGGTLACGFSGPSRPYSGGVRDFVLGAQIINGKGELLRFGGEVMKNVAGYDLSRLMVGALGTLGVILQASLKVLPIPVKETTLGFRLERDSAVTMMQQLAAKPLPISGTCFFGDILYVRLSGAEAAVEASYLELGGSRLPHTDEIWQSLREFQHPFFETNQPLWRISLPAGSTPDFPGEVMVEWGGSLWWLKSDSPATEIQLQAAKEGGHATLFRGGDRDGSVFQPLSPTMHVLQDRLRRSFDPAGLLNPGKMYPVDQVL